MPGLYCPITVFAFFSPYQWLAVPLFVATVFGTVSWLRRDFRFGALLIGFPMLFLTMFCAQYRVVIIRNYLFVSPFFAVLMARGVADFADWLPRSWQRWGLAAALLGALCVNGGWLIAAGESIRHNDPTLFARQALDYVRDHANVRFRVSRQIRSLARARSDPIAPEHRKWRRRERGRILRRLGGSGVLELARERPVADPRRVRDSRGQLRLVLELERPGSRGGHGDRQGQSHRRAACEMIAVPAIDRPRLTIGIGQASFREHMRPCVVGR